MIPGKASSFPSLKYFSIRAFSSGKPQKAISKIFRVKFQSFLVYLCFLRLLQRDLSCWWIQSEKKTPEEEEGSRRRRRIRRRIIWGKGERRSERGREKWRRDDEWW